MQRNKIYILILFTFLLASCSSQEEKKDGAGDLEEYASDLDTLAGKIEKVGDGSLPVINRPHYHTVEIKQMKFWPDEITVKAGDTVVWVNNGITVHDVTEQPGNAWTSSAIPIGTSWQKIVTQSADYYCSIHVVMKGKLVVENDNNLP